MKESDIRKELHKYVDEADKNLLNYLSEAVITYQSKKDAEAKKPYKFNPNATTPMSMQEFYDLIERAEDDLKNGRYYTEEEADAIMDSWNEEEL